MRDPSCTTLLLTLSCNASSAITGHDDFKKIDDSMESWRYQNSQWIIPVYQRSYASPQLHASQTFAYEKDTFPASVSFSEWFGHTLTGISFSRGHIRLTTVPRESRLLLLHTQFIVDAWLINACLPGAIPSPVASSRVDQGMEEQAFPPVPSGTKALKNLG